MTNNNTNARTRDDESEIETYRGFKIEVVAYRAAIFWQFRAHVTDLRGDDDFTDPYVTLRRPSKTRGDVIEEALANVRDKIDQKRESQQENRGITGRVVGRLTDGW